MGGGGRGRGWGVWGTLGMGQQDITALAPSQGLQYEREGGARPVRSGSLGDVRTQRGALTDSWGLFDGFVCLAAWHGLIRAGQWKLPLYALSHSHTQDTYTRTNAYMHKRALTPTGTRTHTHRRTHTCTQAHTPQTHTHTLILILVAPLVLKVTQ